MTSIPASRSARAMIFAPRSCPSRPGFATTTRILRAVGADGAMGAALYVRGCRLRGAPLGLGGDLAPQIRGELAALQRLGEVIALPELAAQPAQLLELLGALDALGDRLQAHPAAELDDRARQRAVLRAAGDRVDEALVDLQRVDRELAQVAQRRVAGAEAVDGDRQPQRLQARQARGR